ncbi:MAG: hypothetical protein ABW185_04325, partial [Sedimenticola sp.]
MSEKCHQHVCHRCETALGFANEKALHRHLKEVHGPRRKCDYCDYSYPECRADNLRRHIQIKHSF